VLRDDGTVWLNLGDSYASSPPGNRDTGSSGLNGAQSSAKYAERLLTKDNRGSRTYGTGIKPKDLLMIPAQVALALRADGWYLRSDIIWNKPNPMPESVTDRPTSAHEHIFLLSKGPRYAYDADAIRESALQPVGEPQKTGDQSKGESANGRGESTRGYLGSNQGLPYRNKRNVWTVATQPYSDAHFATFPPKLIEPCILAGAPEGGTVLDPFAGSGTTGMVALRHGRSFIGCELNPAYVEMARRRICDDQPLFNWHSELTEDAA
jgi:DNA modification methylase